MQGEKVAFQQQIFAHKKLLYFYQIFCILYIMLQQYVVDLSISKTNCVAYFCQHFSTKLHKNSILRNNKCSYTISTLYIFKHLNITSSSQIIKIYTIKMKSHALIRQQFVLVIFQNLLIIYDFSTPSLKGKSPLH